MLCKNNIDCMRIKSHCEILEISAILKEPQTPFESYLLFHLVLQFYFETFCPLTLVSMTLTSV